MCTQRRVYVSAVWLCLLASVLPPLASPAIYDTCPGKTLLKSGGLTCLDRRSILDSHNTRRQSVALGEVSGQPAASNMLEMVWDDELAAVAQNWADQCTLAHDGARNIDALLERNLSIKRGVKLVPKHCIQRFVNTRVARFKVGQNIASTWTTRTNPDPAADFSRQVAAWFDEVRDFGFYTTGFSHKTGHYSQLVWGDTYLVGCGFSYYYDPAKGYTKLYVCNYGPGGNIIGMKPYAVGSPSCEVPSTRYPGLCSAGKLPILGASCGGYTSQAVLATASSPALLSITTSTPVTTHHPLWHLLLGGVAHHNATRYSWYFYG